MGRLSRLTIRLGSLGAGRSLARFEFLRAPHRVR
jgi:hypothetical protein